MNKKLFLLFVLLITISFNLNAASNTSFAETINNENIEVIATYDNELPQEMKKIYNPKHTGEGVSYLDYVFIKTRVSNLREKPNTNSKILGKYTYDSKLKLLEKIRYQGNIWYLVEDNKGNKGYIAGTQIEKRYFRFQMALDKIHDLEKFINTSIDEGAILMSVNTYAPNPSNINPKRQKDKYGTSLDQNLMGISEKGEHIIIPDRSVVKILENKGDKVLVRALSIPEKLEVSKARLSTFPSIKKGFRKVIVIDIENQNFMVFEKARQTNEWELISYVYTKTGIDSQLGYETPKGFFTVPIVKYVMPYTDETGQKAGSAKFAIRFCGGGYLHGTPINVQEEVNKEFFLRQKEFTLGTTTGTRKCVRTSEGHAKFLFDWLVNSPNRDSNEQKLSEDAYFIVF